MAWMMDTYSMNIGATATKVWGSSQTGEFRYGFGNRATLQDVTDGNQIPTIRFANMLYNALGDLLPFVGTVIGSGIFLVPKSMVQNVGSAEMVIFVFQVFVEERE